MNALRQIVDETVPMIWGNTSPKPKIIICQNSADLVRSATELGDGNVVLSQAKLTNAYWSTGGSQEKPTIEIFFNWETIKRPEHLLTFEKIEGIVIHELAEAKVGLEETLAVQAQIIM